MKDSHDTSELQPYERIVMLPCLTKHQKGEFARRVIHWRRKFKIDTDRAAELLQCLPQNILFIERGTMNGMRAAQMLRRFNHVYETMENCRCAVRRFKEPRAA